VFAGGRLNPPGNDPKQDFFRPINLEWHEEDKNADQRWQQEFRCRRHVLLIFGVRPALFQELATVENERVRFAIVQAKDAADNNLVIATRIAMFPAAFEASSILRQDRQAVQALAKFQSLEFVHIPGREAVGQRLLPHRQNVNSKILGIYECIVAVRVIRYAPKHERRIQRHRVKTADRHTGAIAVAVECRYHGNARCKATQGSPKFIEIDLRVVAVSQTGFPVAVAKLPNGTLAELALPVKFVELDEARRSHSLHHNAASSSAERPAIPSDSGVLRLSAI